MLFLSKSRLLRKRQAVSDGPFLSDHSVSISESDSLSRFGIHISVSDTDTASQKTTSSTSFDEKSYMNHDTLSNSTTMSALSPSLCCSCDTGFQCPKKTNCPNFIRDHFRSLLSDDLSFQSSKAHLVAYYVALDEYYTANTLCEMRSAKLQRAQSEYAWLKKRRFNNSRLLSPRILEQMDVIQARLAEAEEEWKKAEHEREIRAQALLNLGRF